MSRDDLTPEDLAAINRELLARREQRERGEPDPIPDVPGTLLFSIQDPEALDTAVERQRAAAKLEQQLESAPTTGRAPAVRRGRSTLIPTAGECPSLRGRLAAEPRTGGVAPGALLAAVAMGRCWDGYGFTWTWWPGTSSPPDRHGGFACRAT